ncbi:cytochrome P450 [Microbacterium mitrae]|uniref:cytochrome P450 n=1 Tax=Microbacterium mitrae TaxID=664640 RepID=UPI001FE4E751|nr:cytochrome P450 [Microbacterium mitrae]
MPRRDRTTVGAARAVVALTRLKPSQELLRAKGATTQAGFTAERIPARLFARRPILIDDGPDHDEHRKQLVRFFSPRALEERHRSSIEATAETLVAEARSAGSARLDDLALLFSVRVASDIVGLTASDTGALARRLEAFFRQPPVDHTRDDHGRSRNDWARAARDALVPLASFYWRDVRPAIRARRKRPADDIISHLLERGYRPREILMECLTYGTAGMVTTREFISMVMLRLHEAPALLARYRIAEAAERTAILSEIIRLNPPVAHLYRRVQQQAPGCPYSAETLVDIDVHASNRDAEVFAPDPESVCPERNLAAAERSGLSFGDGAHRCPGSHLALLETDILVSALLRAGAAVEKLPRREFDTLVQGYQLRDFRISFSAQAAAP